MVLFLVTFGHGQHPSPLTCSANHILCPREASQTGVERTP